MISGYCIASERKTSNNPIVITQTTYSSDGIQRRTLVSGGNHGTIISSGFDNMTYDANGNKVPDNRFNGVVVDGRRIDPTIKK